MSSGAIFSLLAEDAQLATLGVVEVLTDYTGEKVRRDGLTIILRWGPQSVTEGVRNGPRPLDVWVHQPAENSSDYTLIGNVHKRVRALLEPMEDVVGADAVRVVDVAYNGSGGNLKDMGFQTITKNATYRVLLGMV